MTKCLLPELSVFLCALPLVAGTPQTGAPKGRAPERAAPENATATVPQKTGLAAKIAKQHTVKRQDGFCGHNRIVFDFNGYEAWVVEPENAKPGLPWSWTMEWPTAFVDRTGVPDLLKKGYHHVTLRVYDTKMDETGLKVCRAFQKYLVDELGFEPKARLIGMSWGGFYSVRYASTYPDAVGRIYLDAPLLNFKVFPHGVPKNWLPVPECGWENDPRMPVNRAAPIAQAGIPILLLYGGEDQTVPPAHNSERFIPRFKGAGGDITVLKRGLFGHHPHGVDPDKTRVIVDFFENPRQPANAKHPGAPAPK